ncbi:flagellar export protein FliJ [Campylobacter sp. CCUG 57310]|uniref:flagellar export protein FliJ n=1 Tax=Campylobacter sp. CCUG 57310 TaxID=2517362 RepID=UPI001565B7A8|nr:flagellar export protein FliJ [Campylobacter sp. CCUG 57310]QKF91522.1 putative flagellar protein FliJ [Campylobacter sp. CCUG 57310]
MKSKFSQIVKVKKQNLDKISMRLARSRAETVMIEGFIAEANEQIASIKLPQSGQISQMKSSLELLNLARKEKEILTQRLELTKKSIMHYEHQYKNANLEYEKIKYLESEDFKSQIAKIKRAEQNMLDEFGSIRHAYLKESGN